MNVDHQNGGNQPPTSKGASGYTIDATTLSRRLKSLYSSWRENRDVLWGSSTAFAVATPPLPSHDFRYLKSSALSIWLLGYEFPEIIMVFTDKHIHFLCSEKQASLLDDVVKKAAKEAVHADVVMHVKEKHEDGSTQMEAILRSFVESQGTHVFGFISGEAHAGKLLENWTDKMKSSGVTVKLVDVTNGLAYLFVVKEAGKLTNVKKVAYLAASAMQVHVVLKLGKVIDEEKKITHASLMDDTVKAILEPSRIKVKLKAENVGICYPPIFPEWWEF